MVGYTNKSYFPNMWLVIESNKCSRNEAKQFETGFFNFLRKNKLKMAAEFFKSIQSYRIFTWAIPYIFF